MGACEQSRSDIFTSIKIDLNFDDRVMDMSMRLFRNLVLGRTNGAIDQGKLAPPQNLTAAVPQESYGGQSEQSELDGFSSCLSNQSN